MPAFFVLFCFLNRDHYVDVYACIYCVIFFIYQVTNRVASLTETAGSDLTSRKQQRRRYQLIYTEETKLTVTAFPSSAKCSLVTFRQFTGLFLVQSVRSATVISLSGQLTRGNNNDNNNDNDNYHHHHHYQKPTPRPTVCLPYYTLLRILV